MFECDMCGECCRNLDKSSIYAELHGGGGICRYLDGNICSIYENRPLLCRVDECYEKLFKFWIDSETYYRMNYDECKKLKMKLNEKEGD